MTKKQNRRRGFGTRSMSVILALLMVLSTFAVMLTATSLNAGAAISYWFVSGDFNSWPTSSGSNNTISGGSGSVTMNISGSERSSIEFKIIAVENGNNIWCTSAQTLSSGTEYKLSWGGDGANMKYFLNSDTTQVTFDLIVHGSDNYIKVSQNGSGGGSGGGETGQMTYSASVNTANSANTASNLFWAKASYFDYLSDEELSNTRWLQPVQAGTKGFGGSVDEWYPFFLFNRNVVKAQADSQSSWTVPLYFGNFCNTSGAYDTPHHLNGYNSSGYAEATNSDNVTRFVHAANNSDYSVDGAAKVADMHTSYQGLVNSTLSSSGDLLLPNGQQAPYFNASESGPLKGYAKVVNSSFPFKVTTYADKKYKKYTFNSKNATDNVYFTWKTENGVTYPESVNYGAGTAYGVLDGISRFMSGGTSGYGIFPFNNASNSYKGTKTYANENLNYGFGIKTQVKFRVPAPSADVNTADDPIYFRFSGDDDLWMYITDEKGNSQLVLDMGGDHKESTGKVNFHDLTSTVDKVGTSGGSVTKSFNFDYTKTYTMTVFYMERGLIESNCEMEFTMTPLGNNFIVTEEIDTVDVNPELQDIVKQLSTFGFTPYKNNSQVSDDDYGDFELGNGGEVQIPDDVLEINSNVKVRQYAPKNSYLTYDTVWDYYDNVSGKKLGHGTGVTSNGVTTITSEEAIINESGNEYDFAELQVDYRNTPQIGSFSVTKVVDDDTDADYSGVDFPATIYLQFKSDEQPKAYTLATSAGTATNGRVTLRDGETITVEGVPIGTHVYVAEDPDEEYTVSYSHTKTDPLIVGDDPSITVTNTPVNPDAKYGEVTGKKLLDGESYTGRLFRFELEGVPRMDGDAANVIDTSSVQLYTDEVVDGEFTINGLVFDKPGVYRYHVYENSEDNLIDIDAESNYETTYASDFYDMGEEYLVVFTVTKSGTTLTPSEPKYIPYSAYEDMIAAPGASGAPVKHIMVPSDFEKDTVPEITFYNYAQEGSVRIVKTDQSDAKLNGVTFAVYKVDDDFLEYDILKDGKTFSELSDEEKYDVIRNDLVPVAAATTGDSDMGFENGVAEISGLCIFEDGYRAAYRPTYQKYIMIEYSGPEDYNINKTYQLFKFPTRDEYEVPQYDYTFEYINGILRSPSTDGAGMTIFKVIGYCMAGLSALALAGYMLYTKRYVKRRSVKLTIKK